MTDYHIRFGGPEVMIYWRVEGESVCIYSQLKQCPASRLIPPTGTTSSARSSRARSARRSCCGPSTGGGRPWTLGRALGEAGRIAKIVILLAYLDDEAYRRWILLQPNGGDARHALAHNVNVPRPQRRRCASRTARGERTSSTPSALVLNAIAW